MTMNDTINDTQITQFSGALSSCQWHTKPLRLIAVRAGSLDRFDNRYRCFRRLFVRSVYILFVLRDINGTKYVHKCKPRINVNSCLLTKAREGKKYA